eukprot:m.129888 g.129888  ORF g.129888 m.129888 type:complete len:109 (+) comp37995_c0_seq26:374-700(+)
MKAKNDDYWIWPVFFLAVDIFLGKALVLEAFSEGSYVVAFWIILETGGIIAYGTAEPEAEAYYAIFCVVAAVFYVFGILNSIYYWFVASLLLIVWFLLVSMIGKKKKN